MSQWQIGILALAGLVAYFAVGGWLIRKVTRGDDQ